MPAGRYALPPLRRADDAAAAFSLSDRDLPMTDCRNALWVVFSMSLGADLGRGSRHNGHPSMFSPAPADYRRRGIGCSGWRGAQPSTPAVAAAAATPSATPAAPGRCGIGAGGQAR